MDFLTLLALYANSKWISYEEMKVKHQNYCQNLYWMPGAEEKMQEASCDIDMVAWEISSVISWKY